jgi:nitrogen-specific signal transduction histidine kinase/CheY-like chemotaxis protein
MKDSRSGKITGAVEVLRDITETKNLEIQLRQSQKMEAIGTLAGGIAHDFNNLLTTIMGNSELALLNYRNDDPEREDLVEIKKAAQRAATLTSQLLAFSRKQVIQPKILDINDGLRDMENMLRRLIGEDIELCTVLEPELGKIHMDPGQIDQIVINLAVNARDAMPYGGKLTIETDNLNLDAEYFKNHGVEYEPGQYVMLAVSDTGIGMDGKTRSKIFDPFFTTKEKGKGTGLGLSTVYGIVKQNSGYVWVYSEPGRGSTFKIYLPRLEGYEESGIKEPALPEDLSGAEVVLLVEDDDMVRNLARKILQHNGYRVLEAQDPEEAIKISERHQESIDLMLTDVVMPGMNGNDLAKRLEPLRPEMKTIYMSGYTDRAIVKHQILEPQLHFLQKPFKPLDLACKLREVLDK